MTTLPPRRSPEQVDDDLAALLDLASCEPGRTVSWLAHTLGLSCSYTSYLCRRAAKAGLAYAPRVQVFYLAPVNKETP